MAKPPLLGIIGGSGLYEFPGLKHVHIEEISTPFGPPSAPIVLGELEGQRIAFLARHGVGHFISPTDVNYRANIYALKMLGTQNLISITACGSLREDFAPGHIVIPDQLVDFTRNRPRSFFTGEDLVVHIGSADPVCPDLSLQLLKAVSATGTLTHNGGTFITIEGPRFSTKAESNLFRSWGMSIIGMTASPEAFLAREAEMCYAIMAHVTDYDVWHVSEEHVSVDMVVRTLQKNTQAAQEAVRVLVKSFNEPSTCHCNSALQNAIMTQPERIPPEAREKFSLLISKYLQ